MQMKILLFFFCALLIKNYLFNIYLVSGDSMEPSLMNNDIVIINIDENTIVKRIYDIKEINNEKKIFVIGDNKEKSVDSNYLGWLDSENIKGKVYFTLKINVNVVLIIIASVLLSILLVKIGLRVVKKDRKGIFFVISIFIIYAWVNTMILPTYPDYKVKGDPIVVSCLSSIDEKQLEIVKIQNSTTDEVYLYYQFKGSLRDYINDVRNSYIVSGNYVYEFTSLEENRGVFSSKGVLEFSGEIIDFENMVLYIADHRIYLN